MHFYINMNIVNILDVVDVLLLLGGVTAFLTMRSSNAVHVHRQLVLPGLAMQLIRRAGLPPVEGRLA